MTENWIKQKLLYLVYILCFIAVINERCEFIDVEYCHHFGGSQLRYLAASRPACGQPAQTRTHHAGVAMERRPRHTAVWYVIQIYRPRWVGLVVRVSVSHAVC